MLPKCSSEILFSWVQLDLLNHFQPEKCGIGQLMFGVPLPLSLYLCTLTFRHTYIPGFGWPYTCDRTLHTVCDLWVVHTVHPTCIFLTHLFASYKWHQLNYEDCAVHYKCILLQMCNVLCSVRNVVCVNTENHDYIIYPDGWKSHCVLIKLMKCFLCAIFVLVLVLL